MAQETLTMAKKNTLNSDMAIILAKIDYLVKEIREVKTNHSFPKNSFRPEDVKLSPTQEAVLWALEKGELTAEDVAKAVNRTRPLMVVSLNHLAAIGLLERERKGQRVYFRIRRESSEVVSNESDQDGCYLFVVLVSDTSPKDMADVSRLISERLKDVPSLRVEHVKALPKPKHYDGE
jgi:hypothetical protein